MSNAHKNSRTGSVYLVTLVTVGAIVSMVFIGLNMRLLLNSQTDIVTKMSANNTGVFDAAELAIEHIATDAEWKKNAQGGVVFNDLKLENTIYSSTVTDADSAKIPDASTTNYRVKVQSVSGQSWAGGQFDMQLSTVDYAQILTGLDALNYWPLNEAPGTLRVEDEIGSAIGTHLSIDTAGSGTNEEGAQVPVFQNDLDPVSVGYSRNFTQSKGSIAFWVNIRDAKMNSTFNLMGMRYSTNSFPTINISVWQGCISAYVCDDSAFNSSKLAHTSNGTISQNQWHHLTVTWGARGLRVYVDGTLKANNAANTDGTATTLGILGGHQPLYIGGGYLVADRSKDYKGFVGSIAHVAVFDPQLTDDQVKELAAIKPDLSSIKLVKNSWVRVFDE